MNTNIETQFEFNFINPEQLTLDFDNREYFSCKTKLSFIVNPVSNVVFYKSEWEADNLNCKNTEVGRLDWSDGTMKFVGDVDESAQLFFDNIIKRYIQATLPLESNDRGWKS